MSNTPWYKTFFGEDYLRIYDFLISPSFLPLRTLSFAFGLQ
jgi:hypothetical protein